MRKEHGERNIALSEKLLQEGKYFDWVVTTAFYSSIHFVQHAMFPLIEEGVEYEDFNEYWQAKGSPLNPNKHTCKKNLVKRHIPHIAAIYRELLDECHTSRYNNYNIGKMRAEQAKTKADRIRAACLQIKE